MSIVMDYLMEELRMSYKSVYERVVGHVSLDASELILEMNDGSLLGFDYVEKRFRKVPRSVDSMTDEDVKKEFSMKLRKIMRIRGVNQTMLSEMTGIPQPQISRYLSAQNVPSFIVLEKMCRVLKCSMDEFRRLK